VTAPGTAPLRIGIPAPFDYAMGGQWLGGRRFLMVGVSDYPGATQSRLSCFNLSEQAPGIVESAFVACPGADLRAACWSSASGLLFVVDGLTGAVLAAPWVPTAQLPSWNTFVPMFDGSQLPLLHSNTPLALDPIPMGVRVRDTTFNLGHDAILVGSTWVFSDWDARGRAGERWLVADANVAPTQGDLEVSIGGAASPASAPFELAAAEDGVVLAQGTYSGIGVHLLPAPPVFHALPGRAFELRGGSRRPQYLTPVAQYGAAANSPVLSIYADMAFRPELLVVDQPQRFALSMQLKRNSIASSESFTGYVLVDVRNGASDPIAQSGPYTIINGFVLESFAVSFALGERELYVRRSIPIPNDDGFANLVVFFQILFDDGAGGWAVSGIRGSAIRPRAAASASGASALATMSPQQYLHHCQGLAQAADRSRARDWVLTRNPGARQQLNALRQRLVGN
jgi:hypothetical protein